MARLVALAFLLAGCGGNYVVERPPLPISPECDGIIVHVMPSGHFTYEPKCQYV